MRRELLCTVTTVAFLAAMISVVPTKADPAPMPVWIDIKPYSCPNSINLGDQGRLPVAIMGSASLDVADIDPTSIRLKDSVRVTTRGGGKLAVSYEDVYGDGYMDLVAFFKVQDLVAADLNPTTTSLTLTANLYETGTIVGTGSVHIVPDG